MSPRWMISVTLCLCCLAILSCSDQTRPVPTFDPIWTQTQVFLVEKPFEKTFIYTPSQTEIGVKFAAEATQDEKELFAEYYRLTPIEPLNEVLRYHAFELPKGRSVEYLGPKILRDDRVVGALPVYTDDEGCTAYVDPEWITVLFRDEVPDAVADSILSSWKVTIDRRYPNSGIYSVKVPEGMTVFDAIRAYVEVDEVLMVAPFYYGGGLDRPDWRYN